jgi:transposase
VGNARVRKVPARLVEDEDYELHYERVAGIDVAKAKADVCTRLPPAGESGRRASRVETVSATSREVLALAGQLLADGIELVVMESTSDYWRIWFYLLETAGLNVQLVNSRQARQLAGRPKTDQKDAQWIARLAEMGLLRPSFVPPPEIRALRDLTRTRQQLVKDRSREWQRLEKLLEGALVKLSSVVHSMSKTKTARSILEAIAGGERDPRALAALTHGNVRGGSAAIGQALEGMLLGDHHPVLIRLHLDHITLLDQLTAAVEDEIEAALDAIPASWGVSADGVPSASPGPGAAVLPAAERLAEIPGVSLKLARAIIAESGSPGALPRRGPLKTVRARCPSTRLKQAPGALRVVVPVSCGCGPGGRGRRMRVSGGFVFRPACHSRRGGRGGRRRLPCGPCPATSVPIPGGTGAAARG